MSKFIKPQIPANATADERRNIMWNALSNLDLSDKTEKRDSLTYLSWAHAISEFRSAFPSAEYHIVKNPNTGLPYFVDPQVGIMCFVEIIVDGVTSEAWLPVMDQRNRAMKLEPYTYQVYDSFKKQYVEKTVAAATMTDINRCLMRTLVKAISIATGIGLYIYAGEDFPEKPNEDFAKFQTPIAQPTPTDPYSGIKNAIESTKTAGELLELYFAHQSTVEGNPEIKQLFAQHKQKLNNN
ncbi:MAG: DUF1071 domain-containing protein [Fibrobacter sp.]|nr:DUF1071 domain-containing protein [Fibrobacter sp.]